MLKLKYNFFNFTAKTNLIWIKQKLVGWSDVLQAAVLKLVSRRQFLKFNPLKMKTSRKQNTSDLRHQNISGVTTFWTRAHLWTPQTQIWHCFRFWRVRGFCSRSIWIQEEFPVEQTVNHWSLSEDTQLLRQNLHLFINLLPVIRLFCCRFSEI